MPGNRKHIDKHIPRKTSYEDADIGFALTPLQEEQLAICIGSARRFGITAGRAIAWTALTAIILAGGLYAGLKLRRRRLGRPRSPYQSYRAYENQGVRDTETGTEYGAVGI